MPCVNLQSYTMPGEYGKRLYQEHGADQPAWKRPLAIPAWAVVNDEVRRITVTGLRSASGCGEQADYADCDDGRHVATFYLFPVAKHHKPRLETITDEFGTCRQWVAPVKINCKSAW